MDQTPTIAVPAGSASRGCGPLSLRARRAVETRARIVQAAIELFIAQGFEATTTDQIAERADVSPRTLFRAFPTKDALLFHDLERRLATIATRLDERPAGEPLVASIVHVLCATIAEIETSPQDRALLERLTADGSMRRPSIRRYQRSTIVEHGERRIIELLAERAGTTPDDLGLRATVASVFTCFDVAFEDWLGDRAVDFPASFRRTLDAVGRALDASLG